MNVHRSIDDLITNLFQDGQAAGSISEQDMRDFILTACEWPYGGLYINAPAQTTINTAGTYEKVAGGSIITNVRSMDMPVDNRLRYIGTATKHIHLACTVDFTAVGSNVDISFAIYHWDDSAGSGSIQVGSKTTRKIGSSGDKGSTAVHWDLILEPNDYVELWVANMSGTNNVDANFYLWTMGMPM